MIVNPASLGDALIFRGFLREVHREWPDYKILLVCRKDCLVLVKDLADKVVGIDWSQERSSLVAGRLMRLTAGIQILRRKYERIFHPVFSTMGLAHDLCRSADAPVKIAFRGDYATAGESAAAHPKDIYSELVEIDRNTHELDKLVAFAKQSGVSSVSSRSDLLPQFCCGQQDFQFVEKLSVLLRNKAKIVACCIGARFKQKDWSSNLFAELIRELNAKGEYSFMLLGGQADMGRGDSIVQECQSDAIVNLCGKTTIKESIGLIEASDLCVGNDTFGLHAAIVVDTPSVVVMGGGDYPRWIPWKDTEKHRMVTGDCQYQGCGWECKFSGDEIYKCVRSVSVNKVHQEVKDLMLKVESLK